jgi:hypothetical protein
MRTDECRSALKPLIEACRPHTKAPPRRLFAGRRTTRRCHVYILKQEDIMPRASPSESESRKEQQEKTHARDMQRYFWTVAIIVLFVAFILWYFS